MRRGHVGGLGAPTSVPHMSGRLFHNFRCHRKLTGLIRVKVKVRGCALGREEFPELILARSSRED